MRIGLIGSVWISIPPRDFGFGAQEYIEYYIAQELVRCGHTVTLFASGGSKTAAHLTPVSDIQVSDMPTLDSKVKDMFELMNLSACFSEAKRFDIIHNHLLPYGLLFTDLVQTPVVHTLHHEIYKDRSDIHLYERYKKQSFISISEAQRRIMPSLHYISTVYNGVDTSFYTFRRKPRDSYLVFLGRMRKYKGIHTAIAVAEKLGKKLKIVSPLPKPSQADYQESMQYFEEQIRPHLGENIEHIDMVSGLKKLEILQNARAFIFPVEREEPFGMTIIEAQAAGTPTVAYANGSIPELMKDGQTGFLVDYENPSNRWIVKKRGIAGMEQAVAALYQMPDSEYEALRETSRAYVEKHFTINAMVDGYEATYKKILS